MTSPRGISRAEQKRRKGHAIVANDPQAPALQSARRAKPFAVFGRGDLQASATRPYSHPFFSPLNTLSSNTPAVKSGVL